MSSFQLSESSQHSNEEEYSIHIHFTKLERENNVPFKIFKIERNGRVAVVCGPYWFYSASLIDRYNIIFDSNIVNYVEKKNFVDLETYMDEYYPNFTLYEKEHLKIYWVEKGNRFEIKQIGDYGDEIIVCIDEKQWITA